MTIKDSLMLAEMHRLRGPVTPVRAAPSANQNRSKRVGSGRLVGVRLQFSRGNMETLLSLLEMCEDSDDLVVRRIAVTAAKRVAKALAETEPHSNNPAQTPEGQRPGGCL